MVLSQCSVRRERKETNAGNISISNSFGMLEADMALETEREEVSTHDENKENENPENLSQNGNSGIEGRAVVFGSNHVVGRGGSREGVNERKSGNNKGPD